MKRTSYCSALLLALVAPAAAQPAPATPAPAGSATAPAPGGSPTAVPASTVPPPPAGPEGAPVTPPVDTPVTPTEPVAPVEPPPPPPPPAPKFTGLLASSATDQHLARHDLALDKETTVPDHPFTGFVFADYWFMNGPRFGATAGMFRSFEAHLGVLLDSKTTMSGTGGSSTSSVSTRFFYGASVGLLSLYGVQLAGGITVLTGSGDTSDMVPNGTLSLPLDAHWLPFRVEKTRLRITYPVGIGIEWGNL